MLYEVITLSVVGGDEDAVAGNEIVRPLQDETVGTAATDRNPPRHRTLHRGAEDAPIGEESGFSSGRIAHVALRRGVEATDTVSGVV